MSSWPSHTFIWACTYSGFCIFQGLRGPFEVFWGFRTFFSFWGISWAFSTEHLETSDAQLPPSAVRFSVWVQACTSFEWCMGQVWALYGLLLCLEEHVHHVQMVIPCPVSFLSGICHCMGSIQMDPCKVTAVTDWSVQDSRKQLQRFPGFVYFYCSFIRNYSMVVAPLTVLTSAKTHFSWTPEADAAFHTLKKQFTSA